MRLEGHEHAAGEPAGEQAEAGGHEHEGEFNLIWLDPERAIQGR